VRFQVLIAVTSQITSLGDNAARINFSQERLL